MLSKITIDGFKSVTRRTDLCLGPLTVLTGPNSSGKSSVLQSLLLDAQTLQSAVHSGSVVLNGHIERLGRFRDIASYAPSEHAITLGFELDPEPGELFVDESVLFAQSPQQGVSLVRQGLKAVACEYTFSRGRGSITNQSLDLEPVVSRSTLSVETNVGEEKRSFAVSVKRVGSSTEKRAQRLGLDAEQGEAFRHELQYEVQESGSKSKTKSAPIMFERRFPYKSAVGGARMTHFVPVGELVTYDEVTQVVDTVLRVLEEGGHRRYLELSRGRWGMASSGGDAHRLLLNDVTSKTVLAALRILLTEPRNLREVEKLKVNMSELDRHDTDDTTIQEMGVAGLLATLPPTVRAYLATVVRRKHVKLRKEIVDEYKQHVVATMRPLPEPLATASSYLLHYFQDCIKYIGPLRESPRAVYPLSGNVLSPRDVGIRGENAAAVLHNFGEVKVRNVPPGTLLESLSSPYVVERLLRDAVIDWLKYLSVATDVSTKDRGTEGYEVRVIPSGSHESHDVSHVGVGISQVLPIVVQSLLADKGSILLFEQPELHLHPKVQSRLADFFYAMTVLGKQCIVETHSEYLVNRLRYLRALDPGESVEQALLLYFVTMTGTGSEFRAVKIDKYGGIDEWPADFFDEGDLIASDIIRAGMARDEAEDSRAEH